MKLFTWWAGHSISSVRTVVCDRKHSSLLHVYNKEIASKLILCFQVLSLCQSRIFKTELTITYTVSCTWYKCFSIFVEIRLHSYLRAGNLHGPCINNIILSRYSNFQNNWQMAPVYLLSYILCIFVTLEVFQTIC